MVTRLIAVMFAICMNVESLCCAHEAHRILYVINALVKKIVAFSSKTDFFLKYLLNHNNQAFSTNYHERGSKPPVTSSGIGNIN